MFQDLLAAMKMLGLNPMEQEIVDLTNNIVKDGLIYFPEFCKVIQRKFREDDEELFSQNMFKVRPCYLILELFWGWLALLIHCYALLTIGGFTPKDTK